MAIKQLFVLIGLTLILDCYTSEEYKWTPPVRIKSGQLRGFFLKSYEGRPFCAFKNIPYAKSTSGERRFMPPEPVDPWDGVLDSTPSVGPQCPQFNTILRKGEGDEDCLVINAYTPKLSNGKFKELLPVLVFIHGGGFTIGTGSYGFYGPEKLIDYGVVLVTFNYRLGILGFLNTEDEVAPGNYGMLDQVLALRWVNENIAFFGGDPERVTIFGESAGSASVVYHMLSPLSTGLFYGAIAQSGSAMNHWACQKEPLRWTQQVAEKANCPTNDTRELVACLRSKTMREIIDAQQGLQITVFIPANSAPSIEGPGGQGFLTEDPRLLLREGRIANKVPFILGVNDLEALAFAKDFAKTIKSKTPKDYFENEFIKTLSTDVEDCKPHMDNVFKKIHDEYFDDIDVWDLPSFKLAASRLNSDTSFGLGIAETADYASRAGLSTWAYMYTHLGQHSLSEIFGTPPGDYATHMDEIFLQFPFFFTQYERMTEDDTKMSKILNTLWTNFARDVKLLPQIKQGNLTAVPDGQQPIVWQNYSLQDPRFINLNMRPEMKNGKLISNFDFWRKDIPRIISEYNNVKSEL